MKLSPPVVLLAVALLPLTAVACGGGNEGSDAETRAATTGGTTTGATTTDGTTTGGTTSGGTTTDESKETFGEITEFGHRTLRIDDEEVDRKVDLFAEDLLATDEDGYVIFEIRTGTSCDMHNDSEVRVAPEEEAGLDFRGGKFWCTFPGGQGEEELIVLQARLRPDNSVFGIEFEGGEAIIKVTYGSLLVRSPGGDERRLVPDLQLPIRPNGTFTSEPQAIQLTDADRARTRALRRRIPSIRVPPPPPGSAGALGDVVQRGELSVAVDSTDAAAADFCRSFAQALADAWNVDPEVVVVDASTAASGLADGTYDIVVTHSDVQAATSTIPLVDDRAGRTWSLHVAPDEAFKTKLEEFVSADILSATYARRYAGTITRNVTYAPVERFATPGRRGNNP